MLTVGNQTTEAIIDRKKSHCLGILLVMFWFNILPKEIYIYISLCDIYIYISHESNHILYQIFTFTNVND